MSVVLNSASVHAASRVIASDFQRASANRIQKLLSSSGYNELARIRCEVVDGAVKLSGVVRTFHLKQLAQSIVFHSNVQMPIRNQIQVDFGGCKTR